MNPRRSHGSTPGEIDEVAFLAGEAGIDMETIHEEAERLEHAHELADEVDRKLGYPRRDPHGEEIPSLDANGARG